MFSFREGTIGSVRATTGASRETKEWVSLLAPFRRRRSMFLGCAPFLLDTVNTHSYDHLLIQCL